MLAPDKTSLRYIKVETATASMTRCPVIISDPVTTYQEQWARRLLLVLYCFGLLVRYSYGTGATLLLVLVRYRTVPHRRYYLIIRFTRTGTRTVLALVQKAASASTVPYRTVDGLR